MIDEQVMKERSIALVIAFVGKEASSWWWSSKNKAFDNMTPTEMWSKEPERVYRYLMAQGSGDYL